MAPSSKIPYTRSFTDKNLRGTTLDLLTQNEDGRYLVDGSRRETKTFGLSDMAGGFEAVVCLSEKNYECLGHIQFDKVDGVASRDSFEIIQVDTTEHPSEWAMTLRTFDFGNEDDRRAQPRQLLWKRVPNNSVAWEIWSATSWTLDDVTPKGVPIIPKQLEDPVWNSRMAQLALARLKDPERIPWTVKLVTVTPSNEENPVKWHGKWDKDLSEDKDRFLLAVSVLATIFYPDRFEGTPKVMETEPVETHYGPNAITLD
ncbi:hypothetical protein C8J57DRAFT_1470785 [Mycena rebaudengoi]|nr:hypothetical protein C8J57DRAFT_1470785 [Mycena rebaudengoi]